jgi:hypothetical protein
MHALLEPNAVHDATYGIGLAVYQNTIMQGLVDVLRANYPTVERLVGEEWFQSAALSYARSNLPQQAPLALYGVSFAEFLQQSAASVNFPYLVDVARIDSYWTIAHFAVDAPVLQATQLARVAPELLATLCLKLHPAASIACVQHSALTIWLNNRPPAMSPVELLIDDVTEYVLVARIQGAVQVSQLGLDEYQFLAHVQAGHSLGDAAMSTLAENATADIAAILARGLTAEIFSADPAIPTTLANETSKS